MKHAHQVEPRSRDGHGPDSCASKSLGLRASASNITGTSRRAATPSVPHHAEDPDHDFGHRRHHQSSYLPGPGRRVDTLSHGLHDPAVYDRCSQADCSRGYPRSAIARMRAPSEFKIEGVKHDPALTKIMQHEGQRRRRYTDYAHTCPAPGAMARREKINDTIATLRSSCRVKEQAATNPRGRKLAAEIVRALKSGKKLVIFGTALGRRPQHFRGRARGSL